MQAVVKYGMKDGEVEVREMPKPVTGAGRVLLQVKAAGVCGSDIHMWRNHQSWNINLPVVLGHEFCGVVQEVGPGVSGFKPGDRVVSETAAEVCGRCNYCRTGNYNLCPHRKGYGALIDGAFSSYISLRPEILHHIPDGVSFEQASLTEPVCVGYNALVEKTTVRPGDVVVIQGPGMIGLMALIMARLSGASALVVLGADADVHRLEVARQLGATHTLNVQREEPEALIQTLGDGYGADLIVDCTGVSRALQQGLRLVRPNGRIIKVGWGPQPLDFSLDPLVAKAVTLQGSFSHTYPTWERALTLMGSGQIDLTPVIGGVYPLQDWEKAFSAMQRGESVKSVLLIEE